MRTRFRAGEVRHEQQRRTSRWMPSTENFWARRRTWLVTIENIRLLIDCPVAISTANGMTGFVSVSSTSNCVGQSVPPTPRALSALACPVLCFLL